MFRFGFCNDCVCVLVKVRRRERHYGGLSERHKKVLEGLPKGASFAEKFGVLKECIDENQNFLDAVVHDHVGENRFCAPGSKRDNQGASKVDAKGRSYRLTSAPRNLSKVRSTLHQCVREWSSEGEEERRQCFGPLVDAIKKYIPGESDPRKQVSAMQLEHQLGLVVELVLVV